MALLVLAAQDYGPLKDVVSDAGSIIAAGSAIATTWIGHANWEPAEQALPNALKKVGGLVAGAVIAVMWVSWRDGHHNHALVVTAGSLLILTVVFLLMYSYLVGAHTHQVPRKGMPPRQIVGGLWLTKEAKQTKAARKLTRKRLLAGSAYDIEKLWSPASHELAKVACLVGYLGLTMCGTVALGAAAIRLGAAV
jgi:hypothetical protein